MGAARAHLPLGQCPIHRRAVRDRLPHRQPAGHTARHTARGQLLVRLGAVYPLCRRLCLYPQLPGAALLGLRRQLVRPLEQLPAAHSAAVAGHLRHHPGRRTVTLAQPRLRHRAQQSGRLHLLRGIPALPRADLHGHGHVLRIDQQRDGALLLVAAANVWRLFRGAADTPHRHVGLYPLLHRPHLSGVLPRLHRAQRCSLVDYRRVEVRAGRPGRSL